MLDLETLLSQRRLGSYGKDLQAHLENLKLIGKYTHKIALVEIALRNSLDHLLSAKDTEWINNSTDPRVIQMRAETFEMCNATALSHDSYLSNLFHILRNRCYYWENITKVGE
ncbi:hypothetical protein [Helicobacter sp. NHP22-001]|uniref:hypothetical protein n=1 Tax=Helicobacter sp. NHP22-001 TaxID=3040202 RepID=UPI00244D84BA|nr:hypothetical protein [Helicobacter sp. NHP22-001]GMB96816.1 hypothetical protein NHP22001_14050 [Helicobacter sp. NHP22-001]